MDTTGMAHNDHVNAAGGEKAQIDGLLPTLNNIGHAYGAYANILIYVHAKSPVYNTCKMGISAKCEDW
jgi:hypothetical protein